MVVVVVLRKQGLHSVNSTFSPSVVVSLLVKKTILKAPNSFLYLQVLIGGARDDDFAWWFLTVGRCRLAA